MFMEINMRLAAAASFTPLQLFTQTPSLVRYFTFCGSLFFIWSVKLFGEILKVLNHLCFREFQLVHFARLGLLQSSEMAASYILPAIFLEIQNWGITAF